MSVASTQTATPEQVFGKMGEKGFIIKRVGDLTDSEVEKLARIHAGVWKNVLENEKDILETVMGFHTELPEYSKRIIWARNEMFPEGQLVAYHNEHGPQGVIFPLIIHSTSENFTETVFNDYYTLTGKFVYTTHRPNGNTLVCPDVCGNQDKYELEQTGLESGWRIFDFLVLSAQRMGIEMKRKGKIERMIVYTRPFIGYCREKGVIKDAGEYEEVLRNPERYLEKDGKPFTDAPFRHRKLGSTLKRSIPNARRDPQSGCYCAIMQYPLEI